MRPLQQALVLAALLAVGVPAFAEVHSVPGDFSTIQEAVDAAALGDTIVVKKKVNAEGVILTGKTDLVIRAKRNVTVDPGGLASAFTLTDCTSVTIRGFKIKNAAPMGFDVTNGDDIRIIGCNIVEPAESGIRVTGGTALLIEKNKIRGGSEDGIDLDSAEVDLKEPPVDSSLIQKNKITGSGNDGIDMRGANNVIQKNKITGADDDAVDSDGDELVSHDNLFLKNKMVKCGGRGLDLDGAALVARKNKITRCGGGIEVDADGSTLQKNTIKKPEGTGIEILSNDGVFVKNKVKKAGGDGVLVSGTSNTFTKNKATKSGGLDLNDLAGKGANIYVDNVFPNSNL